MSCHRSAPRWLAAVTAMLTCAATVGLVSSGSVAALAPRLGLVAQAPYGVAADGMVEFVLAIPPTLDTSAHPEATLVVTAYRAVTTRAEVAAARAGELPRSVDSVDLPLATLPRPATDQVGASVALETTTRTAAALQLAQPGLYPVVLELRDAGVVLAELLTFIHRLPSATDAQEVPLPVAMAMTTTSPVVLDGNAQVVINDAVLAELTQLADLLEASAMPVAVRVPPGLLLAVGQYGDVGAAVAQRLMAGLARNEVLSAPRYPLDPSLAAAAGQQGLFTEWLRQGEDDLTGFMTNLPSDSVAIMDGPLSDGGGALLRDLGTRLIVTTPEIFDPLPNSTGIFTDSSQLVQLEVAPGITVDATLVDRDLDGVLAGGTTTPVLTGIYTATHLLAYRQEIVDITKDRNGKSVGDPSRRGVTLGTTDLSLPNTDTYRAITTLLADTPGLMPTTLEALGVRTNQSVLPDRGEVVVGLAGTVEGSIADRVATVAALTEATRTTGSMLPTNDPRLAEWSTTIDMLPTSALTDEQVSATAATVNSELAAIRAAVELPTPFQFTLTGRTTTVPIRLYNHSDVPLTVRVHMSSSKLFFGDDVTVELPPQSSAPVDIEIEARTNGRFPVTLTVLTPSGDILAEPVPLNASVNALSGNLFTSVFLAAVLMWWVRHARRSRRARATATTATRHPVRLGDTGDNETEHDTEHDTRNGSVNGVVDEAALSPDAATSTLPPS